MRLSKRIRYIFTITKYVPFLFDIIRSKEVHIGRKLLYIGLLVFYFVFPYDLIPDFIPVGGYIDDVFILLFFMQHIVKKAPDSLRDKHQLEDKK